MRAGYHEVPLFTSKKIAFWAQKVFTNNEKVSIPKKILSEHKKVSGLYLSILWSEFLFVVDRLLWRKKFLIGIVNGISLQLRVFCRRSSLANFVLLRDKRWENDYGLPTSLFILLLCEWTFVLFVKKCVAQEEAIQNISSFFRVSSFPSKIVQSSAPTFNFFLIFSLFCYVDVNDAKSSSSSSLMSVKSIHSSL